ncbi:MAG: hypothetical protein AB1568_05565 [Thermodesulfobacteriota bacterium]
MKQWQGDFERRGKERVYTGGGHALVVLPQERLLCEMVDVSMEGIGVYYLGRGSLLGGGMQRGILVGVDDLWLAGIPLRTVSDTVVRVPLMSGRPCVRRRGMHFGSLSGTQRQVLEQYILLNGRGSA